MEKLLRVDFHFHSNASKDSLTPIERIVNEIPRKGLDMAAITDHNCLDGALAARDLAPERIIVGEEILTQKGELLAYYLEKPVPPGLPPMKAIDQIKAQGAFISVSHPFDLRRSGWQIADLSEIVKYVDAIETFNARSMNPWHNHAARLFADNAGLSGTAGSDGHTLRELGRAYVELPAFSNADELRESIKMGRVVGRRSSLLVLLASTYAKFFKKLFNHR